MAQAAAQRADLLAELEKVNANTTEPASKQPTLLI